VASPDEATGGVSVANWPTADIALPTDGVTSASNGSTAPVSTAPFPGAIPSKPIHIPAEASVPAAKDEPTTPEQSRAFKLGVPIMFALVGLAVIAIGFFGWKYLSGRKSAAAHTAASSPAEAATSSADASPAVTAAEETPVAPHAEAATIVLNEEPPKAALQPLNPEPSKPAVVATRAASDASTTPSSPIGSHVAPGVTASVGGGASTVGASPEFRAFVATVKISGVFQGENSRAFINGRMTRLGETIDNRLGVVFEGIDVEKKQIIFKDAAGALATRRY
jgi:hypothetical protein